MKLRREQKIDSNEIVLDPKGLYDLGGYGVLIEHHPRQRQIVKNAITGKMMDKKQAYMCGRTASGHCFYLPIGIKLEGVDLERLIPSNFNELKGD